MFIHNFLFIGILFHYKILFGPVQGGLFCDSRPVRMPEGNIGQTASFPWLGILRVHVHGKDNSFKVALTGIVLIKDNYCIANSDDIAKIPRNLLKSDSKAMFIKSENETYTTKVKDVILHPEYEYDSYNTITLLELEVIDEDDEISIGIPPVCWPTPTNTPITSNQLYVLGLTDEHRLIEKVMMKAQNLKVEVCDEFYNRAAAGIDSDKKENPTHFLCAYASKSMPSCNWENGMVLAANSSGRWFIIGFSVKGSTCAAPARFIDMTFYTNWIDITTSLDDEMNYRRGMRNVSLEGYGNVTLGERFGGDYSDALVRVQDKIAPT